MGVQCEKKVKADVGYEQEEAFRETEGKIAGLAALAVGKILKIDGKSDGISRL